MDHINDTDIQEDFVSLWVAESLQSAIAWARGLGLAEDVIARLQRCPLHGDALELGQAVLRFGKPRADVLRRMKEQARVLPYRNDVLLGGCVMAGQAPFKTVVFCPTCRSVRVKSW